MKSLRSLLLLALALGLCACDPGPSTPAPPKTPRSLRFGIIPFNDLALLHEESHVLAAHLSRHLGRKIRVVLVPDYASMTQLLLQERLDLAWLTPATFMLFRQRLAYELLSSPARGSRTHRGVIAVRRDSPYHSLQDLKGRVFAYVDRYSTTGFVFPNLLMEQRGIDPLRHFARVSFSYNHGASLAGLRQGHYDAVAVHDRATGAESSSVEPEDLRILARTPPIPPDPIVVHRSLDPELKERCRVLLLKMKDFEGGEECLATLTRLDGVDRFLATTVDEYSLPDTIRTTEARAALPADPSTPTTSVPRRMPATSPPPAEPSEPDAPHR